MTREEQIEKARELLACGALSEAACMAIKADFPELSESEDERIRKWIVSEIKHQYLVDGKKIYCEEAKDALDWLERQKEQKPTSFNEPYNQDEYEVVMEGNATSLKRKEQKPAEHLSVRDDFDLEGNLKTKPAGWSDEDEGMLGSIIRLGALDNAQSYWLKRICSILRQQKPAEWSKEDEKILNNVAKVLEGKLILPQDEKNEYASRLQTFSLKHKVEWDKTDKIFLDSMIDFMEKEGRNFFTTPYYPTIRNWLKALPNRFSLRPSWKPSDEQYYALRDAIIKLDADDSDARFPWEGLPKLHSLANDLFELRKNENA